MPNFIDLVGHVYGRLEVISKKGKTNNGNYLWKCLCECGKTSIVSGGNLRNGHTRSCGCLNSEVASKTHKTHGMRKTPIYNTWLAMRERCSNVKHIEFKRYGGRGISVCSRWADSFENFLADMGEKPTPKHSIDRRDSNGNYTPENCRWATIKQQQRNRRNNLVIIYDGQVRCLSEWAEVLGIGRGALKSRINADWPIHKAFTQPVRGCHS